MASIIREVVMASRKMPPPRPFAMGEVRKRLRGSKIIYEERDGLATEMLAMAAVMLAVTGMVLVRN